MARSGLRGRDRMIASINTLTGRTDCTEAVVMQQRPAWLPLVAIGLGVILLIASAASPSPLLFGALAGAAAAGVFVWRTTYWLLGRCDGRVLLARSSKWSARAVELVEEYSVPMSIDLDRAIVSEKVVVGGRTMYLAKPFKTRLTQITGP